MLVEELTRLHPVPLVRHTVAFGLAVDWALGHAAVNSHFAEADLASIVGHHARANSGPRHQASETRSLTQGTGG